MSTKKERLKLDDVQDALNDFFSETAYEIKNYFHSEIRIGKPKKLLVFDDKVMEDENELKSVNGKYFINKYWPKGYSPPHSGSAGVYIFFDKNNEAIYVGNSVVAIGNRVCTHIRANKFKEAEYFISIPFENCRSLARAFEHFLIKNNKIPRNRSLTRT